MQYENLEPGYSLGINIAQSITKPLAQDSLSSFHDDDTKNRTNKTIDRFKDLTENITNNNDNYGNSKCEVILKKENNYIEDRELYNIFVYKEFHYFIKEMKIFNKKKYNEIWLEDNNVLDNIIEITIDKEKQYKFMTLRNVYISIY